ncbi:MAG: glutathione peroxidase [Bacteroidales bacterium]|nr:glutathione peroxidase [Bacteroidales bacterium]
MFCVAACKKEKPRTQEQPVVDTVVTDTTVPEEPADNIYQFKVLDGNGDSVSLAQYRGKVLLVVNTATQCGYTPQYTDLERIYEKYQDSGFVILDFPCNQFGSQAPGSYDDIHNYCTSRYGITFPQFAKVNVNGLQASPLYVWLKSKKPGDIQWNFTKFLVDRNGEVKRRFEPGNAMSTVEKAVENAL